MSEAITIIARSSYDPGNSARLKEIVRRLKAHIAETEPDTLGYEWYFDDEAGNAIVIETYGSSEAVLFHAQNYASFAQELSQVRELKELQVCGVATDQLKQALATVGAQVMLPG